MAKGKQFDVTRKVEKEGKKTYWARVGTLFMNEDGKGGTLYIDLLSDSFAVFEKKERDSEPF